MTDWSLTRFALAGLAITLTLLICVVIGSRFVDEGNVSLPPRSAPTEAETTPTEILPAVDAQNAETFQPTESKRQPTITPTIEIAPTSTRTLTVGVQVTPTTIASPTVGNTPAPEGPLPPETVEARVISGESGGQAGWFVILRNPNDDWIFEDVTVDVVSVSAGVESGLATLVLQTIDPGETVGIGEMLGPQTDIAFTDLAVRVTPGRSFQGTRVAPQTAQMVSWQPGSAGGQVTALIGNGSDNDILDMAMLGVVRDASGEPTSMGVQTLAYLPAKGETGAVIGLPEGAGGATADFYLARTSSTRVVPPPPPPLIDTVAQGLVTVAGEESVIWSAVYESRHSTGTVTSSEAFLTFLDASGVVRGVQTVQISDIRPQSRTAVVASSRDDPAAAISGVLAYTRFGRVVDDSPAAVIVEDTLYLDDQGIPRVESFLRSFSTRDLIEVQVLAVAYGADGTIIGAGAATVPELPASGWSFAQVRLTLTDGAISVVGAEMFVETSSDGELALHSMS